MIQVHSAPVSGLLDLGRYPVGIDDAGQAIADALDATDVPVGGPARHHALEVPQAPHEPGQRGRGAVRARGSVQPAGQGGSARGQGGAGRRRHRRRQLPRRTGSGGATTCRWRHTTSGEWQGGSSWQSLARGTGSIEAEFLNGEIVLLGALHGVATPVNALLQRLAAAGRSEGRAAGLMERGAAERLAGCSRAE